ncbi:MAG: OsmC family protein [Nitritalea sp.]
MPTVKSSYLGKLRTEMEHVASGSKTLTDAPVDNHGRGEAFSPTDLVAAALGSCMVTIMGIVAERDGVELNGMHWEVEKVMASDPRRIAEIRVSIFWPEAAHLEAKFVDKLKRAAKTCPVALSLDPALKQDVQFHF